MTTPATFLCTDCGEVKTSNSTGGTGYATADGDCKICYDCCAVRDRAYMAQHGKIWLYWDGDKLSNWPGTLTFKTLYVKTGHHNWGHVGKVTTIYFRDADGNPWSARHAGELTQVARCRRISERAFKRA